MNPSLYLLEDEIFGLEMKLWTQCSNRLRFETQMTNGAGSCCVHSLAKQLAEAAGTSDWRSAITKRLIESGSPPDAARQLAAKLNWAAA